MPIDPVLPNTQSTLEDILKDIDSTFAEQESLDAQSRERVVIETERGPIRLLASDPRVHLLSIPNVERSFVPSKERTRFYSLLKLLPSGCSRSEPYSRMALDELKQASAVRKNSLA